MSLNLGVCRKHLFARLLAFFVFLYGIKNVYCKQPSLIVTMMCRDEAVNLNVNLAAWTKVAEYFVFLVDSRTQDDTEQTIERILGPANKDYKILQYDFQGFGQARTLSLETAWEFFPQGTHIMIADPDWSPDTSTMDLNELDDDRYTVFRFKCFDRNGASTRAMDWMLKHREGLRMRYHLHEVLDIGSEYIVKQVSWVVHEIERPGTWHATVGHGHSMSTARYYFDLALLYKDLATYRHDPHTHYYLGVTHHAVAEKTFAGNGNIITNEITEHLEKSIYYLTLRSTSIYKDEFQEERWSVMYLLGALHSNLKMDHVQGLHWFKMCRDISPNQPECSIAIISILFMEGKFEEAWEIAKGILRTKITKRKMMNYFKMEQCNVPNAIVQVLLSRFQHQSADAGISADDVRTLLLMNHKLSHDICNKDEYAHFSNTIRELKPKLLSSGIGASIFESSLDQICKDPETRAYIFRNHYHFQSCDNFNNALDVAKHCSTYDQNLPPAREDLQIGSFEEFIGALSVFDVIHHVYNGAASRIFSDQRVYRILLAEDFHPKLVLAALGFFARVNFKNFEIIVVSPDQTVLEEINSSCDFCGTSNSRNVHYIHNTIKEYVELASKSNNRFHYIECNGGLSMADDPQHHLSTLESILSEDGVLGLTYFADNNHVRAIRHIMQGANRTAHLPFSVYSSNLIRGYLQAHGLEFLADDPQLMRFLGAQKMDLDAQIMPRNPEQMPGLKQGTAFVQSAVERIVEASGLEVAAWMPTAYSKPYDELDSYDIRRHQSYGVTQEQFIQDFMPQFRYTGYVVRKRTHDSHLCTKRVIDPGLSCRPLELGVRPSLDDLILNASMADHVLVIDRIGNLGQSFTSSTKQAMAGKGTTFGFQHYALRGHFKIQYTAAASVAAALPLLSDSLSIDVLMNANYKFCKTYFPDIAPARIQRDFADALHFLAKINVITFWSMAGPINEVPIASPVQEQDSESVINNDLRTSLDNQDRLLRSEVLDSIDDSFDGVGDEDLYKVGGLNFDLSSSENLYQVVDFTSSENHEEVNTAVSGRNVNHVDSTSTSTTTSASTSTSTSTGAVGGLRYNLGSTPHTASNPMEGGSKGGATALNQQATSTSTSTSTSTLTSGDVRGKVTVADAGTQSQSKASNSPPSKRFRDISQDEKASRMRKLGFSEKHIADLIYSQEAQELHDEKDKDKDKDKDHSKYEADDGVRRQAPGQGKDELGRARLEGENSESVVAGIRVDNIAAGGSIDSVTEEEMNFMKDLGFAEDILEGATGKKQTKEKKGELRDSVTKEEINYMKELGFAEDMLEVASSSEQSKEKRVEARNEADLTMDVSSAVDFEMKNSRKGFNLGDFVASRRNHTEKVQFLEQESKKLEDWKEKLTKTIEVLKSHSGAPGEAGTEEIFKQLSKLQEIGKALDKKTNQPSEAKETLKRKMDAILDALSSKGMKGGQNSNSIGTTSSTMASHEEDVLSTLDFTYMQEVGAPSVQSEHNLLNSCRRNGCIAKFPSDTTGVARAPGCEQELPVKRRTAAVTVISHSKIYFDSLQVEFIKSKGRLSPSNQTYQAVVSELQELSRTHRRWAEVVSISDPSTALNRVLHLEREQISSASEASSASASEYSKYSKLFFSGAIEYLKTSTWEVSDFVVMDTVLQQWAMETMRRVLLLSTIWFDITNGRCFAAHHDDGLVHPIFTQVAKQIAYSLSNQQPQQPLKVVKYYALICSATKDGQPAVSPVIMAPDDSIIAVVWLSSAREIGESEKRGKGGGLMVYEKFAGEALYHSGTSIYPSVHPDFLSKARSLDIDISQVANKVSSELVQEKSNRMVLIKSNRPITFETSSRFQHLTPELDKDYTIAFVVVMRLS